MIVPEKFNYFQALQVTGKKFLFLFFLTFLISQWIQINGWSKSLIPDKFIVLTSSALGIFLGFRINAAYLRWRDGHGLSRDLVATCLSVMSQATISAQFQVDKLHKIKEELALFLLQYAHLVRLELLGVKTTDWRQTLSLLMFNKKSLFPLQTVNNLLAKKRKSSYVLSQLSQWINTKNLVDARLFLTTSDLAKSMQQLYLIEQGLVSLKYTPFPWGYQFYTRLFVWTLPILFIFSSFNQFTLVDNAMMSFISMVFLTLEQVSRNLDNPINHPFNGVPFNALCRALEIGLLEHLDIEHDLTFLKAKNGLLS